MYQRYFIGHIDGPQGKQNILITPSDELPEFWASFKGPIAPHELAGVRPVLVLEGLGDYTADELFRIADKFDAQSKLLQMEAGEEIIKHPPEYSYLRRLANQIKRACGNHSTSDL